MQTRGCYETTSFVCHTIAFQPLGSSLDLHKTSITFMSSDTESNRVTNFSKGLHTFSSYTFAFSCSGLKECLDWDIMSYSFNLGPAYFARQQLWSSQWFVAYVLTAKAWLVEFSPAHAYSNHMFNVARQIKLEYYFLCLRNSPSWLQRNDWLFTNKHTTH